ncbi:MAG: carboxypeptidase-like regulatory domain-containing protein, partial [Terriglobales bacterium]
MRPAPISASALAAALLLGAVGLAAAQSPNAPARAAQPASAILYLAALQAGPVAGGSGQMLGMVAAANGRPQPGAVVEVRADGLRKPAIEVQTSADGLFRLAGLAPGTYFVQAGVALAGRGVAGKGMLVAQRQRVEVHASERALLLFNLPAFLHAMQFGPPASAPSDQAFEWALRQSTLWRPILHWDDAALSETSPADSTPVQGYVALTAGAGTSAFASTDLATAFRVDTSIGGGAQVSLTGEVGTNGVGGGGDTRVQTVFSHHNPANPERMQVAVRQISIPGLPALPSLRVFTLNYSNALSWG